MNGEPSRITESTRRLDVWRRSHAVEGYSLAFGARFLKRVIDERIKILLTLHCKDAAHFRVLVDGGSVVVDALTPRAAASFRPASYLDVA